GGDDNIFLTAAKFEIAVRIEFAEIASAKPAAVFLRRILKTSLLPVTARDIFTANEDFSVFGDFEFAAGENFPDGAVGGVEGMVETDERSGFRHTVALYHRVTETLEKKLAFGTERGSAGDECPEAKTEKAVNAAEAPGAVKEGLRFCGGIISFEPMAPAARIDFAFESGTD